MTRTGLAPCGSMGAWNRHVRERAKLRRQGVPAADLPPIDEACRAAARAYQAELKNRARPAPPPTPPPAAAPVEVPPAALPAKTMGEGKLQRLSDSRTAATVYRWEVGSVVLEVRRRLFPDGKRRWELHPLPGSTVPAWAEAADPTGDNWTRLGDVRLDLDRFARAITAH